MLSIKFIYLALTLETSARLEISNIWSKIRLFNQMSEVKSNNFIKYSEENQIISSNICSKVRLLIYIVILFTKTCVKIFLVVLKYIKVNNKY